MSLERSQLNKGGWCRRSIYQCEKRLAKAGHARYRRRYEKFMIHKALKYGLDVLDSICELKYKGWAL